MKLSLEPLTRDQWPDYKALWLEALRETPQAFSADYESQAAVSDETWQERLDAVLHEDEAVMVFARINGNLVGMIGAYFEDNPKFSHIATIWGAYVKPEFRKQGIATDMARALLRKLEAKPAIVKVKTYSVTNGHLAVNVYKTFGFDIIGISKRELSVDGTYYDVYIMEKFLK